MWKSDAKTKMGEGRATRPPGTALDGLNLRVIQAEIQPSYQFPNGTRTVIVVDQLLDIHSAQQDLAPINRG